MPVYEYRCSACGKKFSALIGMTAETDDERCPHCGSAETTRLVSRFARVRNEDQRMDSIAQDLEAMDDPESPAAMRRMVREVGKALDEDVADDMEEMLESDLEADSE